MCSSTIKWKETVPYNKLL